MKLGITIGGMSCEHCVAHVTNALSGLEGISEVNVSLERNLAIVEADETVTPENIKEAIEEQGYELEGISEEY